MTSPTHTEASSPASSPVIKALGDSKVDMTDAESGYGSATSSVANSLSNLPQIVLTKPHIKHLNKQLEKMEAVDRLRFVKLLFPNLYQSTAFGLTGLVTIDMLSKLENAATTPVDIIFLDTLYHFQETLDLVEQVKAKYPGARIHTYQPDGASSAAEFEERYGSGLYETAPELYDWIAKVEPQQRSYSDLGVAAILTGRRRSQGGERDQIQFIEVDEERGIIKVNPLVDWTFARVKQYIDENAVPYNPLLDRGYKSVGDWHSTSPVGAAEDERAGRWRGQSKTECGIHNKKSRYAQFLQAQQQKEEEEEEKKLAAALGKVEKEQHQQAAPLEVV